jgi:NAD(P)-dependent dehydrogenase (short-subunit alcohol dehydrogenase family)
VLPGSAGEWNTAIARELTSLYLLCREFLDEMVNAKDAALLAVVTRRGGALGIQDGAGSSPVHQGVADFVRTVSTEYPGLRPRIVDVGDGLGADEVFAELASDEELLEVGLTQTGRVTARPVAAPLAAATASGLGRESVFLVTGGARGITSSIVRGLAKKYRPRLILAGRTELTNPTAELNGSGAARFTRAQRQAEVRATLDELRRDGAQVEYHAVDVCDASAFGALIDDVYARFGRIDVAIHGAGIIEDKLLKDKQPDSFERVIRTKAAAAWTLAQKLNWRDLRALVFFGSVSAVFGNRGQCDYAAANGILNGLARSMARPDVRVVSMNWGPWEAGGMAGGAVLQQLQARGIEAIQPEAGVAAFLAELEGPVSDAVIVLGGGPWCAREAELTSHASGR